jgi:hypothetical protein
MLVFYNKRVKRQFAAGGLSQNVLRQCPAFSSVEGSARFIIMFG